MRIRNFKRFEAVDIELARTVVFIGPNNSGKTTALQALALWNLGLRRWNEKRQARPAPEKRPGITINRRDLLAIPTPEANLLWRDLHVRNVQLVDGKQKTRNINIEITVDGVTNDRPWECGLEFDYANEASFYCRPLRPLRIDGGASPARMPVPDEAGDVRVAYLPPMSGLTSNEVLLEPGAVSVRIGEGRTAEVLRNLCYRVFSGSGTSQGAWARICARVNELFGVDLDDPEYLAERGEISMTYRASGTRLDLSSAGRGLQQTLLLLAYLETNPGAVLLLDEPDAHLEILRQRQIYDVLTTAAAESGSQIVAASHSEVILNEAADRDTVVAFVGKPHRIDDRGAQVVKSLKQIGFEQYYQAEQRGWVLYVEGSTDLAILRSFAKRLQHPAIDALESPFVHYIGNLPRKARSHFHGLREAKPDLVGFVLCDRLDSPPQGAPELPEHMWERREIENYLCQPETLLAYVSARADDGGGPLFASAEVERHRTIMTQCVQLYVPPAALENRQDRWWRDVKASEEFLDRVFATYAQRCGLPVSLVRKSDYHELAAFVPLDLIAPEVSSVLDAIHAICSKASGGELPS